jgi:outer membrane lipoprotein SlyB
MKPISQRCVGALRAIFVVTLLALAGCAQQPSYQVISQPVARTGTVESVREMYEEKPNNGLGMIAGGLIGGGLGSLVGAGGGRTAATIVGALGGGYLGNQVQKDQMQMVYQISVRYDDGSWATIRQTSPTGLRIGDRVAVTDQGIDLLRR